MTGMIEKVYSDALFQIGIEEKTLDLLFNELNEIAVIFNNLPDFLKLLSSPSLSYDEKITVADKIFKGKVSERVYYFLEILIEKKRIGYFCSIAEKFKTDYNDHNNILEITVTTVKPLKNELKTKLIAKIEAITNKTINVIEKTDESIIGGIVLNYGNTQVDSSIKSQLDSIRIRMKNLIA